MRHATDLDLVENIEPKGMQDRRETKRISFYKGEFPGATIEVGGRSYEADVYDLSSNGVCILPCKEIPGLDNLSQEVNLSFKNSPSRKALLRNIGHIRFSGSFRLKLGLELKKTDSQKFEQSEKFDCSSSMPLAYFDDPIAFNRRLLFNAAYFSKDGIGLQTGMKNSAFFVGLVVEIHLMMPSRGEFSAIVEIVDIKQKGDDTELFCVWKNCPVELANSISEFLLMTNAGMTIRKLRTSGFLVAGLERAFMFSYAQTTQQIESILDLRLKAAQSDGRWLEEIDSNKMWDSWDDHARQIYCEVNGRVVASARIVYNNGLRDRSEHENYDLQIPDWLWQEGFVEGSRVCTDPEFRGSDVFILMLQQMSKTIIQSGYRYLVLNCADSLVPIYKKFVGVHDLKVGFHTAYMGEERLNLLYIDVREIQVAINFAPSSWIVNAPVGDHLVNSGQLKLKWWESPIRKVFRIFHSISMKWYKRARLKKAKADNVIRP